MNILAICAALNNSYLGIKYEDKIISKIIKSDENYHSLYLITKIKEICNKANIDIKKLNAITVNCGPGSFTGIRVAISIAKIIAGELDIPLIGLNSAEILLTAFNKEILLMDARRDMYFLGTKEKIDLIYKNKLTKFVEKNALCDKNCSELFKEATCFEVIDKDLARVMLDLAQQKYINTEAKNNFNYLKLEANYIQTPPIF